MMPKRRVPNGVNILKKDGHVTVCHISPFTKTKGGITTVLTSYACAEDEAISFRFVESHRDGSLSQKIAQMLHAIIHAIRLRLFDNIDIAQVHVGDFPSLYRKMLVSLPFFIFYPGKTILHLHGAAFLTEYGRQPRLGRWMARCFIHRFDLVIVLSEKWKFDLESVFKLRSVLVLPNAVDIPKEYPTRNLTLPRRFLFLGSIGARKGVFDLIKASSVVNSAVESFSVKVGGNGDSLKLISAIRQYELMEVINYIGWVTSSVRHEAFMDSHVLILPSYAEGAPMSVIEGMAMGMPIISTKVGAIPEMVKDGYNGILVEPGDLQGLADAMITLCMNNTLAEDMGRRSYEIAKSNYSFDTHFRNLSAAYFKLKQ